jgi:hypothetical protein
MMEITQHQEIEQQVIELSKTSRSGAFYPDARELAKSLLEEGFTHEQLLEAFENVRGDLRALNREDQEDELLEVMDDLTGWSSSHSRL